MENASREPCGGKDWDNAPLKLQSSLRDFILVPTFPPR